MWITPIDILTGLHTLDAEQSLTSLLTKLTPAATQNHERYGQPFIGWSALRADLQPEPGQAHQQWHSHILGRFGSDTLRAAIVFSA